MTGGLRRWLRPAVLVHLAGLLLVGGMYFSNSDWGGDPDSPRGDGKYRPILARGDGHLNYLMLRSLVLDGDLDLTNDFKQFHPIWKPAITRTGRPATMHPIGTPLLWAPFFIVAHAGASLADHFGASIPMHGYTMWHQRIVFVTAPLFTFLACVLGCLVARRWVGGRWAPLYASLAVLLGTSATAYATHVPASSHPADAVVNALFLFAWARGFGDLRPRRFLVLGLLLGLAALVRITGFALAAAPAVEAATLLARGAPGGRLRLLARLALDAAIAATAAALAFLPQMIAWKYVFDEWLVTPMGAGFVRLGHPQIVELLFSSRNGWFSLTPLAYAGMVGLAFVPRTARPIAAGLLAVVAVQLYVNSCVYDWWAGASFGARRMISATAVLVVGLAALLAAASRLARRAPVWIRHAAALLVLGWFAAWNLDHLWTLRRGRSASIFQRPACCDEVAAPYRALAMPIYRLLGNPFSLPASAVYALRTGHRLSDWDKLGGYVLEPNWDNVFDGHFREETAGWNPAHPGLDHLVSGFGPVQPMPPRSPRAPSSVYRWSIATPARVLMPLLLPEAHCVTLRLHPRAAGQTVRVGLDGATLVDARLAAGWNDVTVVLPEGRVRVGENPIELHTDLGELAPGGRLPPPAGAARVGVAISRWMVSYPRAGVCPPP